MFKAVFIARASDGFLLCEYKNDMVTDYAELRSNSKRMLQNEKIRMGEVEFVDLNRESYVK